LNNRLEVAERAGKAINARHDQCFVWVDEIEDGFQLGPTRKTTPLRPYRPPQIQLL